MTNNQKTKVAQFAIDKIALSINPVIRAMPEAQMFIEQFRLCIHDIVRYGWHSQDQLFNAMDYMRGDFPEMQLLGVDPDYIRRILSSTGILELGGAGASKQRNKNRTD